MNAIVRQAAALAKHLGASCLLLSASLAEAYSWQVSGSYLDEAEGVRVETRHRWLRATHYLSPVEEAAGPYELAPFLSRSSYVSVGAGTTKLLEGAQPHFATDPGVGNNSLKVQPVGLVSFGSVDAALSAFPSHSGSDASDYAVDGRYVWPASGWYAGARAQRGDSDAVPLLPVFRTTSESRRGGVFAGRYFGPRTALEVELGSKTMSQHVRMIVPGFDPLFGLPHVANFPDDWRIVEYEFFAVTDVETDRAAISVRHVGDLSGSTFELSASVRAESSKARFTLRSPPALAEWGDPADWPVGRPAGPFPAFEPVQAFPSERQREVRLSGAWFPARTLGVRLSVSTSDHDARGTGNRVGLAANWFFVRNAAVEIELTHSRYTHEYPPDSRDAYSAGMRLLGRF